MTQAPDDRRTTDSPQAPSLAGALRRRLLTGGCWVAGGRLAGIALALAVNVLLARMLPASDYGRFAVAVSFITFCGIPARFGLDRYSLRMISGHRGAGRHDAVRPVIGRTYRLLLFTAPAAALAAAAALRFAPESLAEAVGSSLWPWLAVGILLHAVLQVTVEMIRALDRVDMATLLDGQLAGPLLNLVLLGAAGGAAWRTGLVLQTAVGLYCLALAVVLVSALATLARIAAAHRMPRSDASSSTHANLPNERLAGPCLAIAISAMLSFACYQADLWIAAVFCTPQEVGLFAAARRLVQLTALPLATLNLAVIGSIPSLYVARRLGELQSTLQMAATAAMAMATPAALVMALVPERLLDWAFGPAYSVAAAPLAILVLGQLVFCWTGPCTHSLILTGHHTSALAVHVATTLLYAVLGPLSAIHGGITGLAVVSASLVAANNLGMLLLTRLQIGVWTHASVSSLLGRAQFATPA